MNIKGCATRKFDIKQRGAALVTVVLVSLLLGTACIAMLSAVSASSKNNTDALSENKAYYAAESGLQAAVNFFRYDTTVTDNAKYSYAVSDPTLGTKLTYATVNGISKVAVGSETGYSLYITDPDNSAGAITYSTVGSFKQADGYTYAPTRVYSGGGGTVTISYLGQSSTTANHPITTTPFGNFQIIQTGTGVTTSGTLDFRIDYVVSAPRPATRTIRGSINMSSLAVSFGSTSYSLMGSTITLCNSSSSCSTGPVITLPAPTTSQQSAPTLYGRMTPIEPVRLKVLATGYGPAGTSSMKQLEAIVQRNFFNDLGSSSAISMLGPNAYFRVGTSNQMSINGGSNTSITVSDSTGLNTVNTALAGPPNRTANVTPPPEIAGADIPYWQQSPAAMDAFVNELKQAAQQSGRYFTGSDPASFGDFTSGTGITFCDRSCTMGGNSEGGGILVVTHTFFTSGNPRFNGLVLVVGQYNSSSDPGGVVRSGGGNEIFTGNIVIAPYDPNNLLAGWGQPRYDQNGGAGDTINSEVAVDQAFDGTSAITDFMLGVAEK